ncbi:MAG TPA: beta-phosphoglucomutase [Chroococcales cyanobacterium]
MRQAVIFDLDGVITDTARYHFLAWRKMAQEEGMEFDEHFNERLKGIDRMGSLELILVHNQRQSQYSQSAKLDLADRKNEYYKTLIEKMTSADLLPGAAETLRALRDLDIKVGLASASRNAQTILNKLAISHLFDYVVDSGTIKFGKPDPEIFLAAADRLKIRPSDCVGVEDAIAGVQAIKAAGMFAVGIGEPTVLTAADLVVPGLDEFPLQQALASAPMTVPAHKSTEAVPLPG